MIDTESEIINSVVSSFKIQNCLDSVGKLQFLDEIVEDKIPFGLVFQYEPTGHYYINLEGDIILSNKSQKEDQLLKGGFKFKLDKIKKKNKKSIKKYSTNNKFGGMVSESTKDKLKEDIIGDMFNQIEDNLNLSILVYKIDFEKPESDITENLNISNKDHIIPIDQKHSIIVEKIKKLVGDILNDMELVSYTQLKNDLDYNQSVSISDSIFNLISKLKKKTQKKISNFKKSIVGGNYKKYSKSKRKKKNIKGIIKS